MKTLNPNHPVTQLVNDHKEQFMALLVHKAGGRVLITREELLGFIVGGDKYLVTHVHPQDDSIEFYLTTPEQAKELVNKHGGKPY